jgi:hypothetical protein
VLGGIAAVLHGVPRATFDLDILIEPSLDNAERLLNALVDAGMGSAALTTPQEILAHEITIFNDRIRLDVQTSTPGLDFEKAWRGRVTMQYHGQEFYVLSREHLIASKRAAGRRIDLDDVRALETGRSEQPGEG